MEKGGEDVEENEGSGQRGDWVEKGRKVMSDIFTVKCATCGENDVNYMGTTCEPCRDNFWTKVQNTQALIDENDKLRAQIADLEIQHVGDKAIIEALNERVRELEGLFGAVNAKWLNEEVCRRTLEARLTQLKRPPMTRELPKVEGWFWWEPDDAVIGPMSGIVRVVKSDGGQLLTVKWGTIFARTLFPSEWRGLWSARPIEMDPMPEGGER